MIGRAFVAVDGLGSRMGDCPFFALDLGFDDFLADWRVALVFSGAQLGEFVCLFVAVYVAVGSKAG